MRRNLKEKKCIDRIVMIEKNKFIVDLEFQFTRNTCV